jgi:hypothetical protein
MKDIHEKLITVLAFSRAFEGVFKLNCIELSRYLQYIDDPLNDEKFNIVKNILSIRYEEILKLLKYGIDNPNYTSKDHIILCSDYDINKEVLRKYINKLLH